MTRTKYGSTVRLMKRVWELAMISKLWVKVKIRENHYFNILTELLKLLAFLFEDCLAFPTAFSKFRLANILRTFLNASEKRCKYNSD